MAGLQRFTQRVNRLFLTLSGVLVAVILAMIAYDLVLRNVFDSPTLWALDLSRFMLVYVFFLALAPALESGSHVAVDILDHYLPPAFKCQLRILALALVLVFGAFLLWQIARTTFEAFDEDGLFPTTIPVKMKWIYWIGPIGVVQFLLTGFVQLVATVRSRPMAA